MTIKASSITTCKECGSKALSWHTANRIPSDIQQGRLRTNDVECLFVLGCDHCSETLATTSADQVAAIMNKTLQQAKAREGTE